MRSVTNALRLATRAAAWPSLVRSAIPVAPKIFVSRPAATTSRGYATANTDSSSLSDPATVRANELLELANRSLEDGDVSGAKALYDQSCKVQETPTGWYNLGVCEYHLSKLHGLIPALQSAATAWSQHLSLADVAENIDGAVAAWEKSLALSPSPDAHTNLASAYIMSKPPRPADAIKHLTSALELTPEDPEIAFNLAAVLESTDNLDHALQLYKRASEGGVERAEQNIRNISAKILSKKAQESPAETAHSHEPL